MSKIKILFLLIAFFVLTGQSALAWDDVGHKLTAYIAWQQLTPAARANVIKILRSAPEDSNLSAYFMGDSRSEATRQREFFMLAATWADIVRDRDFKVRYAKYHHGVWHYLDTFWRETNGKVEVLPEMESAKENAVERLFVFDKVLRDASASSADKAIALAWFEHLEGDIHQPLHASGRVTAEEPKGDQGGNTFLLTPKDGPREQQVNLHWYWDSIVMRYVIRKNDACDSDYLPKIANEMMKKYPLTKMQSRLNLGKYDDWQKESFQIASTKLYPSTLMRNQMPSAAYKKMAFQIAQEQIALAGYRMGATLNQIFGGQSPQANVENEHKKEYPADKIGQSASDAWLWTKTRAALATVGGVQDSTIIIDVQNNVITLKGTVADASQKSKAEQVAKSIKGAKNVFSELKVSK